MEELRNDIQQLVAEEYVRASKKFGGKYNSTHEAYGVILEEEEETALEMKNANYLLNRLKKAIFNDDYERMEVILSSLHKAVINLCCESVQFAQTLQKFSMCLRELKEKSKNE